MKQLEIWNALQIFAPVLVTLFALWAYYHTPGLMDGACSACAAFEAIQNTR